MVDVSQNWFEMSDVRRRRYANVVWIPLRLSETIIHQGEDNKLNSKCEIIGVNCVAIPIEHKEDCNGLNWTSVGLMHEGGPFAFSDGDYKHCEKYQENDHEDFGVDLVMVQHLNADLPVIWHVNQDMILALNLYPEGDFWVRPEEGYVQVIRQRRGDDGQVIAIEMKSEYLKDYLAVRGLALRLITYRQRTAILQDKSFITWGEDVINEETEIDRLSCRTYEVDAEGCIPDRSVSWFQSWRTDVDEEEDVPVFGEENDDNTDYSSSSYRGRASQVYQKIEGELWRNEWLEPDSRSIRIREDEPEHELTYIVDAGGKKLKSSELNNEDIGRYLWFSPDVMNKLTSVRGGGLSWYTDMTGGVWCSPSYKTHWGMNKSDLITVYAYDIAKLPQWQQGIWAGCNVTPEGAVSAELLAAQMKCQPADTKSPEDVLKKNIDYVNALFLEKTGVFLFRAHEKLEELFACVHRFNAKDREGVLRLAKDITRVTTERIDASHVRKAIKNDITGQLGSIKLLEKYLAQYINEVDAKTVLSSIVGIYELRGGDSHLPSSDITESFILAGVDLSLSPIQQGMKLLQSACEAWGGIASIIESIPKNNH